ncbi:ribosomal RNA small subunit methyltransferase A [Candidatus Kaiserbacteria bacterium]|nr:ribosomal RNA small subunit methyltransferase A [Candidatus Kaiserbacteria bacterium]
MKKRSTKKRRGAKLGQHLLTNAGIAEALVEAAEIKKDDAVLEIGPGGGILTREILKTAAHVVAVEKDPAMVATLRELFKKEMKDGRLVIHEGDARELTPDTAFPEGRYKVAANIPYYITGELMRMCLTAKNQPLSMTFLVQKEVAERIVGNPERSRGMRSKKESILSLSVKAYGEPKYIRTVSKGNFNPVPNVDSAILAVRNISRKNFKKVSEEMFFKVVKAGFAQKRKTLAGNLKKVFGPQVLDALVTSDLPEKIRAEDVSLEKWFEIISKL